MFVAVAFCGGRGSCLDASLFKELKWREVGPYRGGRSAAVTGVPSQPNVYYFGRHRRRRLENHGFRLHVDSISDGFFGGSIGAVAVSESDPNVIYVGGGEKPFAETCRTVKEFGNPQTRGAHGHIPGYATRGKSPESEFIRVIPTLCMRRHSVTSLPPMKCEEYIARAMVAKIGRGFCLQTKMPELWI